MAHRRLILTERRSDMFEICSELERHMKYIGSKMNDPILFQSQMKTVDELRNMIIEKREEVDRLKNTSEIKKHRLKDLKLKLEVSISCENKYFIEPLPKIQRTISSIYSRLGYLRSLCDSYQQESMDLRQALVSRRQRLLYELTHAFEVENIGGGKRALRGLCLSPVSDLMAKLTSDGQLPLTASAADLEEEDAALGYITLLICQISKILDVPLRMTPVFAGSRSYVWDTRGVLQSQLPECMEYIMEATPGIILGGVNTPGGLSDQVLLEGDIANLQTAIANTGCVRLPLHLGPVPEPKANLLLQQQAAANSLSGLGGVAGQF